MTLILCEGKSGLKDPLPSHSVPVKDFNPCQMTATLVVSEIVTPPLPSVHSAMVRSHQWLPRTEHVYVLGNLEHHLSPLCQISETQKGAKVVLSYPLKESRARPDPQLLLTKINCLSWGGLCSGFWLSRIQGVISGLPAFNPGERHLEKQAIDRGKKG